MSPFFRAAWQCEVGEYLAANNKLPKQQQTLFVTRSFFLFLNLISSPRHIKASIKFFHFPNLVNVELSASSVSQGICEIGWLILKHLVTQLEKSCFWHKTQTKLVVKTAQQSVHFSVISRCLFHSISFPFIFITQHIFPHNSHGPHSRLRLALNSENLHLWAALGDDAIQFDFEAVNGMGFETWKIILCQRLNGARWQMTFLNL